MDHRTGYSDHWGSPAECMYYPDTNMTSFCKYDSTSFGHVMFSTPIGCSADMFHDGSSRVKASKQSKSSSRLHPLVVARRNERERNRVSHVNATFSVLRQHLPTYRAERAKKMSKVETLRNAIKYIRHLKQILAATEDPTQSQSQFQTQSPGAESSNPPSPSSESFASPSCQQQSPSCDSRSSSPEFASVSSGSPPHDVSAEYLESYSPRDGVRPGYFTPADSGVFSPSTSNLVPVSGAGVYPYCYSPQRGQSTPAQAYRQQAAMSEDWTDFTEWLHM